MFYMYITLLVNAFAVQHIDFDIESLCEDNNMALAVTPDDYLERAYPVLSWAHGMGSKLDEQLMETLANEGYVVVAARGCRQGYVAAEHSANQLKAIDWVLNVQTEFKVEAKVGVLGHSMGGRAAIMSTLHHEPYHIKAAVAEMPGVYTSNSETPQVPTFFVGGTRDKLAPWQTIVDWYDRTKQVDKVLAIRYGVGHLDTNVFTDSVLKFLDCHVRENVDSCLFFYPPKEVAPEDKEPSLCDDQHFKVCYASEYDPANPEAEIEYAHKFDEEECTDWDIEVDVEKDGRQEWEGRIPCLLAAKMSKLVLGECPMFLNSTCCHSCTASSEGKLSASQMTCVDSDAQACSLAANKMFEEYGQCPRSVAESCCASCATLKLRALNPDTKLQCPGWPWDFKPQCKDDLHDCSHLAAQGRSLFGECPAFLKVMCCNSCKNGGKSDPGVVVFPDETTKSTTTTEDPNDYIYDYPYDSAEPEEPESPNKSGNSDDLCPAGQKWNKCGDICPPECDDGSSTFRCTSNFCVPQCECTNGKFKDSEGECTFTACQVWEDMNNFDFMPFDPSNIPGFDPKPHHRPVGPVHPDNIPIHPEQNDQPAQDNSDPTGEDYYSEYGDTGECVNEDSTRDLRGHTCTEWYDDHPRDCGQYDRRNHGFTARTQCCACFMNRLAQPQAAEESTSFDWESIVGTWQFGVGIGFASGLFLGALIISIYRCRQRKEHNLNFDILLEDAQESSSGLYSMREPMQ